MHVVIEAAMAFGFGPGIALEAAETKRKASRRKKRETVDSTLWV